MLFNGLQTIAGLPWSKMTHTQLGVLVYNRFHVVDGGDDFGKKVNENVRKMMIKRGR